MQTNPVKAIREFCIQCYGGYKAEVKTCPANTCPLYAFRMGKNPYRKKRELTDDQRKAASERMNMVRSSKED